METITIRISQAEVYDEVAKATDYTGSKLPGSDVGARDRILAADDDLAALERFWEEAMLAINENLKEMLISGQSSILSGSGGKRGYEAVIGVSKSFDKALKDSVQLTLRSVFIAAIIGEWFKFANKGEAADYVEQAARHLESAKRLLYSRLRPRRPTD